VPLPAVLLHFEDLREGHIDRRREPVFSQAFDPFGLFIDGRTFDHDWVDQTVALGATAEWRIVKSRSDWHPFHIHVNDFQVMSVNREPVDPYSREDTTPVPAFGRIVIRTRFLRLTGKFVYHCHILDNEDRGMMGIIEVVE
jgi:suppressor of ftsI